MNRLHTPVGGLLAGVVVAMAVLLVGVWLGSHPSSLPSPRGSFFESDDHVDGSIVGPGPGPFGKVRVQIG
jgi:hypothetical protein